MKREKRNASNDKFPQRNREESSPFSLSRSLILFQNSHPQITRPRKVKELSQPKRV